MTRKDYTLIAEAIARSKAYWSESGRPTDQLVVGDTANLLANALRRDNPRFDKARFMDACGFSATD